MQLQFRVFPNYLVMQLQFFLPELILHKYSVEGVLRNKQITSVSRLMSLSRLYTTVIGIQGSAEGVIASSVFDAYLPVL